MSDIIDDHIMGNDGLDDIYDANYDEQDNYIQSVVEQRDLQDNSIVCDTNNGDVTDSKEDNCVVMSSGADPSFGHHEPRTDLGEEKSLGVRYEVPFGNKEEDNAWNAKQANHAFEEAEWHLKQASNAAEKGDLQAAKDHRNAAESWRSTGNDYKNKIK